MIYIHIPFCRSFCTYCDFYSEIPKAGNDIKKKDLDLFDKFTEKLCSEIRERSAEIIASKGINTLYIGGGTPSVLPLIYFQKIINSLPIRDFEEFTLEANPEDIVEKGIDYIKGMMSLGVNRLSMGVQSFDDKILRWMNRRHSVDNAIKAFNIIREAGISNISIDLIFGIDHLSKQSWEYSIDKALELNPEHISAYQLSIEDNSTLGKMLSCGKYKEANERQCFENYQVLTEKLRSNGYLHYEISNFAKSGYEAKHNSAYWDRVPYVGLGAGAHSFDGHKRSWNSHDMLSYTVDEEVLSQKDANLERLMLGLRTSKGISKSFIEKHFNKEKLSQLLSDGKLELNNQNIRIAEQHFFICDSIISSLL